MTNQTSGEGKPREKEDHDCWYCGLHFSDCACNTVSLGCYDKLTPSQKLKIIRGEKQWYADNRKLASWKRKVATLEKETKSSQPQTRQSLDKPTPHCDSSCLDQGVYVCECDSPAELDTLKLKGMIRDYGVRINAEIAKQSTGGANDHYEEQRHEASQFVPEDGETEAERNQEFNANLTRAQIRKGTKLEFTAQ